MKCKNYEHHDGMDGFCENITLRFDDFNFISGGFKEDRVMINGKEEYICKNNCHQICKNFKEIKK